MQRGGLVAVLDQHMVARAVCRAGPDGELVGALHLAWDVDAGRVEEGGREVDKRLERVVDRAGGDATGPAHEKWQADQIFVVEGPLGDQPVLAKKMAVVGAEDDECIVGDAQLVQSVENASDLAVHQADHAVVDGHVFAQGIRLDQMAVEAMIAVARLLPGGEVRIALLRFGEVGRHRVELARFETARLHGSGIVHGGPWFGHEVGRMWIVEAAPEEEGFIVVDAALDCGDGAFSGPDGVVARLGQVPGVFAFGRAGIGRPGLEVILPVGQAVFLHPDAVVLAGVGFVGVVTGDFDMLKAVPRAVKVSPEVEVAQGGLAFEGGLLRARGKRLEVGLADQRGVVAVGVQHVADGGDIFRQLDADGPAAMPGWVLAGNDRSARGRADGIVAVGAVEAGAFAGEPVQGGRLDLGIGRAKGCVMLLVAGDQQDVWECILFAGRARLA